MYSRRKGREGSAKIKVKTALCAFASWALPSNAWATVMLKLSVDDLAAQSDLVVRGAVQKRQSHWTPDHRRIVTEVEIAVEEPLKGQAGKTVTVLQPGGEVGDIGQHVAGVADFSPQEKVVVFLERKAGPHYSLVGLGQGKWKLERTGGEERAVPAQLDATLLDPKTGEEVRPGPKALKLDELRQAVKRSGGKAK